MLFGPLVKASNCGDVILLVVISVNVFLILKAITLQVCTSLAAAINSSAWWWGSHVP